MSLRGGDTKKEIIEAIEKAIMKTSLRKVYQCEHCNRNMISAGAMSRHEKFCRYNPQNRHKCFDTCRHLQRSRTLREGSDPFSRYSYSTNLICGVTGIKMYSYLLEKTGNFRPKFLEGLTRAPLECTMHEYMTEKEIERRFNPQDDEN